MINYEYLSKYNSNNKKRIIISEPDINFNLANILHKYI